MQSADDNGVLLRVVLINSTLRPTRASPVLPRRPPSQPSALSAWCAQPAACQCRNPSLASSAQRSSVADKQSVADRAIFFRSPCQGEAAKWRIQPGSACFVLLRRRPKGLAYCQERLHPNLSIAAVLEEGQDATQGWPTNACFSRYGDPFQGHLPSPIHGSSHAPTANIIIPQRKKQQQRQFLEPCSRHLTQGSSPNRPA